MIVLGFDDPRNSDLSTQRHNGRWPMAPWRQWHARVRRRRAAARARMKPARLSPAPYTPGPTPDVPCDPPTSAGRPARTELICLGMRTHRSLRCHCANQHWSRELLLRAESRQLYVKGTRTRTRGGGQRESPPGCHSESSRWLAFLKSRQEHSYNLLNPSTLSHDNEWAPPPRFRTSSPRRRR